MELSEVNLSDEHWPKSIEKDLERSKEHFAKHVRQHHQLKPCRQVGVQVLITQELMVELVVRLERCQVGDPDRHVGEDGKQLVVYRFLEQQVVAEFVDGEEHRLVGGGTDHISGSDETSQEHGSVSKQVGTGELDGKHKQHPVLGYWLVAGELGHLGVLFEDELSANAVGFLIFGPVVIVKRGKWSIRGRSLYPVVGIVCPVFYGGHRNVGVEDFLLDFTGS